MAVAEPRSSGDPAQQYYAVTPADGTDLPQGVCNALYVGGAGNVAVRAPGSSTTVVFSGVAAGQTLPIQVQRVMSTNTTATLLVALY